MVLVWEDVYSRQPNSLEMKSPALALTLAVAGLLSGSLASDRVSVPESFLRSIRSPRPFHARDSPARNRTCVVESHNDHATDDSEYILEAVNACNPGGHVLFPREQSYQIGRPLNLTHLSQVDLDIQGAIQFSDDLTYWQNHTFDLEFQNSTSFVLLGGKDVNVYGGGSIHGNGQLWWDAYAKDKTIKRPILLATAGLQGGSVSDLNMLSSPFWHNIVMDSEDVTFHNIYMYSVSDNENFEKNTDGWDTYRSTRITIQNSTVNNGDDCVSFKPNSTDITVRNMHCNGTHGISVGSLGQYPSRVDYVENIHVFNVSMYNSSEGARIKVWPDSYSEKSSSLTGGGGRGLVRNVTYDTMWLDNVDYGLTITQCYGQDDEEECFKHPAKLNITDVKFHNIRGRTNRVFAPLVAHLVCSSPETCSGIEAKDVDIRSINGSNLVTCRNVDRTKLDLNCVDWSKGYNPA
ncbi:extracellular exo-polygalacturonase-like protein [Aspergillus affinis]|uniref:extracellular exo-polygalacturonase-like protein n=1 Tax=Aspergillus affinis TaxID=1070780 RepID=UPI0022FDFAA0|nr:extracellular exo-polygalacturonase-like protein [Aspergillus affinis]KAI9046081.1 extracellular exo-polygalacturonase-like protein [Aspergillus affinis]